MPPTPVDSSNESSDLLIEIVETLELCGVDSSTYRLHDHVDVEALTQLITSTSGDIAVQFTVEGIRLNVSPDGVAVPTETQTAGDGQPNRPE